jgi:transcription initiation factor TFIIIB Brf1 subunit/transcription initiation factor TFIIB
MQGVQGILKSGRTRLAAYENYALDRCPECRANLVRTNEEDGGERACSRCGVVAGRANTAQQDGSLAPSVSKNEPLGSYITADTSGSGPPLKGPAFGWARLMPNIIGRATPLLKCSRLTGRIAEKLALPKSIAQSAEITARRLLPHREAYCATVPSISAYSLLYACRSAGIAHISHREVLKAYTDAGYRVSKSELLRLGLESGMPLPHPTAEDFVRAAIGRLQSSEGVIARLRKANLDPKAYFTRLFELAKEVAKSSEPNSFSPRTVAAGSVYLASLAISARKFSQREAGDTLGMAEYTVRDFCSRSRNEKAGASDVSQVRPVKSGPALRRT